MEEIIIKISKAEDGQGYFYDIFGNEEDLENADGIDGGLCTTTLLNTLEMATSQAKNLINKNKKHCHLCGHIKTNSWCTNKNCSEYININLV